MAPSLAIPALVALFARVACRHVVIADKEAEGKIMRPAVARFWPLVKPIAEKPLGSLVLDILYTNEAACRFCHA